MRVDSRPQEWWMGCKNQIPPQLVVAVSPWCNDMRPQAPVYTFPYLFSG